MRTLKFDTEEQRAFIQRIKIYLKKNNLKRKEVAKAIGYSDVYFYLVMNEKYVASDRFKRSLIIYLDTLAKKPQKDLHEIIKDTSWEVEYLTL